MFKADKTFSEFNVGDSAEFEEIISEELIVKFSELSKDYNPLHTEQEYASQTEFKGTIAHGMIAGALFSRLLGMHLPGKYCLYLKQTLNFKSAVRPNTQVIVSGLVVHKTESINLLSIKTVLKDKKSNELYVEGEALVKVLK